MNQYDIKMRLYRSILFVGALLSVICIIGNYLSSFPFWPNLKWIALFLTTVTSYLFSKKNYIKAFMFGFFLSHMDLFPFAFFDSGGSNNNAIGYAFLLLITVTYLFSGWKRFSLYFLLLASL